MQCSFLENSYSCHVVVLMGHEKIVWLSWHMIVSIYYAIAYFSIALSALAKSDQFPPFQY
jgi:hypothetical protein